MSTTDALVWRHGGCAGANILPETSTCVALEVLCANDDDESYVVPQLVFKFK